MKIPKAEMLDILDTPNVLEDTLIGSGRWSVHHRIVFKYQDKFYQTTYSVGATEYQNEGPWEYEDDIECQEVRQVEKLVKVWEPVVGD